MKAFLITTIFFGAVISILVLTYNEFLIEKDKIILEKVNTINEANKKLEEAIAENTKYKNEILQKEIKIKELTIKTLEQKEVVSQNKAIIDTKEDTKVSEHEKQKNLQKYNQLIQKRDILKQCVYQKVDTQSYYKNIRADAIKYDKLLKMYQVKISTKEALAKKLNSEIVNVSTTKDAFGKTDTNPFGKKESSTEQRNNSARRALNAEKYKSIDVVKKEIQTLQLKLTEIYTARQKLNHVFIQTYRAEMDSLEKEVSILEKGLKNENK